MRTSNLIYLLLLLASCTSVPEKISTPLEPEPLEEDNGKRYFSKLLENPFNQDTITDFDLQIKMSAFREALESQKKIIRYTRSLNNKNLGQVKFGMKDIKKTHDILSSLESINDSLLFNHFDYYQLLGEDSAGNVHFTGYFTPTMEVRSKKDSIYKYPFYSYPKKWKGQLPTREQIDKQQVLANKNLELAWSNNLFDNFILQVQGSGMVQFEDGTKKILAYGGKNGYEYKSIGRYFVNNNIIREADISVTSIKEWFDLHPDRMEDILNINESYIFFNLVNPIPKGAAGVSLVPEYSSAIDTNFIPMGSALLAEVPKLDSLGNFLKHEYQILFAMDRGGAIKGPGRLDIYFGVGDQGFKHANHLNHYGRVWLLCPKQDI